MTIDADVPGAQRPAPVADEVSAPFFEGLRSGRLQVQRCDRCAAAQLGERRCFRCGSSGLEWIAASGRASLRSAAVVRTAYHPAFATRLPYAVALVELEEGPQLYAGILEADPAGLRLDMPLVVRMHALEDGTVVPAFAPAPVNP